MTFIADYITSSTQTFQRDRQLLLDQGVQEGVVGSGDLKVTQRAAGANMTVDIATGGAFIQIDTGTRNGVAHIVSDAVSNVAISASNASLPRIDQIIIRYNDTSIPTGSGNTPTPEVLTGTATSGATLDNRSGAQALPPDCMRVADIIVPAASTSVTTGNIRDRRPWARGAYCAVFGPQNGASVTTPSGTEASLSTKVGTPRVEIGGNYPVEIINSALLSNNTAGGNYYLRMYANSTFLGGTSGASIGVGGMGDYLVNQANAPVLAAGSYVFDARIWGNSGGVVSATDTADNRIQIFIREVLRPNTNNN